ncbi:MAG: hypothetical protein HRU77_01535 [Gammaproteobacteria bacterium]|jgi:hypothetical protein|nr:MAG: hypothetical protein HRU77_01535 [Gammaproteobacteria bacterium]
MDALDIVDHDPGTLSISSSAAQSPALEMGVYQISVDCDCRIRIGAVDPQTGLNTTKGIFFKKGRSDLFSVGHQYKIAVIAAAGATTGTLEYHWVGRR